MKRFLYGLLLTLSLIASLPAYTQTETYCLPIAKARLLFEDAIKKKVLDTIVNRQGIQIKLLQEHSFSDYNSFQALLKIERDKFEVQKDITTHTEALVESYKEQSEHFRKQSRARKWQRNGIGLVLIVVIAATLSQ